MTARLDSDPFDLHRFVEAQNGVYEQAVAELRAGRKRTHWMWFVFPQVIGLGRSRIAQRYAISSAAEARAYLAHPTLGPRLIESAQAVLDSGAPSAHALLGSPDDLKLHSSMTLFGAVSDEAVFASVLDRFYTGEPDAATLERI